MPSVGPFHRQYWKARANALVAAGVSAGWMYPGVQSVVTSCVVFAAMPPALLLRWARESWTTLRWMARLLACGWRWRSWRAQMHPERWFRDVASCDLEQLAVLADVVTALTGPHWAEARTIVRRCATTPKFHRPEAWVDYSRAIKANPGQAQNVFRHVKGVHELRGLTDGVAAITNPEAHLLIELAYHGLAAQGRRGIAA